MDLFSSADFVQALTAHRRNTHAAPYVFLPVRLSAEKKFVYHISTKAAIASVNLCRAGILA